ncbi:MAG: c-type cytochrome domain-containing protein, partial [Verrucomicrobiota bacterium]
MLQTALIGLFVYPVSLVGKEEDVIMKMDAFLSTHCFDCHDDLVSEADLDLTALDFDPKSQTSMSAWELVFQRVKDGEMPPKKKKRPEIIERLRFTDWIVGGLQDAMRDKGGF